MPDIEIKRGYEVLPENNVRFGIMISDFEAEIWYIVDTLRNTLLPKNISGEMRVDTTFKGEGNVYFGVPTRF